MGMLLSEVIGMGIEFGGNTSRNKELLQDMIDWLNGQQPETIKKWLLSTENRRTAIKILSLDDDFIRSNVQSPVILELFRILPFAKTQLDWVTEHPHAATRLLWYLEGCVE